MLVPRSHVALISFLALVGMVTHCSSLMAKEPTPVTEEIVSRESVVHFLHRFEELAGKEDFSLIEDMVHEQAFFRFNDGDFVGRKAVQAAFEKTWKGGPGVKKERFYLSDVVVLSVDNTSATATTFSNNTYH